MDAGLWRRDTAILALSDHFNTVFKLVTLHTELRELVFHSGDTIAFLDPLIRDACNLSCARSHCSQDGCCKKRICHGFHVNMGQSLELTRSWSCDSCRVVRLLDRATHGSQHIDGKASIALQRLRANVGNRTLCASDGGDRQRCDRVLRIRSGHENGRDILGGNGCSKLDVASLETTSSIDPQRQTVLFAKILNLKAVRAQSINQRTDRTNLHPRVTGQDIGGRILSRRGQSHDSGQETGCCSGISQIKRLFASFSWTQNTKKAGELSFLHHANGNSFAVEKLRCQNSFECVANGVTEVEKIAKTAFSFITGHDLCFDTSRTDDNSLQHIFDGESADKIFAHWCINGSLSTDGRVDHGEQGGGYLDKADTTHEGCCNVTDHISHYATTQSYNDGIASALLRKHPVFDFGLGVTALRSLAGRNCICEKPCILSLRRMFKATLEGRNVGIEEIIDDKVQPQPMINDDVGFSED
ncbi:hypothetical protein HG531_000386 [Fusarium graminearum]|nr:hypothetical protein HG531_000386 [Fusarium graminearum]